MDIFSTSLLAQQCVVSPPRLVRPSRGPEYGCFRRTWYGVPRGHAKLTKTLFQRVPRPLRARPWLLRMELNREAVFDKRLDVVEIAKRVVAYFDGGLHVIRSDQNSEKLVRRK